MSATEELKSGAACRYCPDAPCLEDRHACCYINAAMKWSLELVARQPGRIFNPLLICLSHPAFYEKMVPQRGDAPRSAGYRPAALLLSYRGMKNWRSTRECLAR